MGSKSKHEKLELSVMSLYEQKLPEREAWADFLYEEHLPVVVNIAEQLANKYSADVGLCKAAAWLHDIADAVMSRFPDEPHVQKSLEIAKELMVDSGYNELDIKEVTEDALPYHSCRGDERPRTQVGKILAAADALAHLTTDFYLEFSFMRGKADPAVFKDVREKLAKKIERDYYNKLEAFPELRDEASAGYQAMRALLY